MNFSPAFLDEIRARLSISEVVGKHVKLRKQGREWRGLSPFNAEKTPSFYVNDQKGRFFDFSAGRDGDIFEFLMAVEGIGFPDAVERLAAMAGLALPQNDPQERIQNKVRADLSDVLTLVSAFYQKQLSEAAGAPARYYLEQRSLTSQAIGEFGLGYSPADRFAQRNFLAAQGIDAQTMIDAGLLIHGEDIKVPYDRFRNRIMFPIADRQGRIIAFGGRALDQTAPAKYLNSPETPLFHKGAVLYNHHRARIAAHKSERLIVVEGYMDVIAMTMAGCPEVVAPLGTALTEDQCQLLWKMSPEPILCFDGDKAGRRAAYRAIETALPFLQPHRTLRFALLPEGIDPDDLARTGGRTAVEEVLDKALPLADLLWQKLIQDEPLKTPEQRAGLEQRIHDALRAIADNSLRRHYEQEYRRRLYDLLRGSSSRSSADPAFSNARQKSFQRQGSGFARRSDLSSTPLLSPDLAKSPLLKARTPQGSARETLILAILIHQPALLLQHVEELAALPFSTPPLRALHSALLSRAAEESLTHEQLLDFLEKQGLLEEWRKIERSASISSLSCVGPSAALNESDYALKQAMTLHRKFHALHPSLRDAETALGQSLAEGRLDERDLALMRDIQDQLASEDGTKASLDDSNL